MESTILGLRAETSIHAGTGQSVGAVDLPIQREAHTGWPCIFGSAMKGALRCHAETRGEMTQTDIPLIFGPESSNASDHAGALAVTDARLLLLPVRSLTGHFKWVTCRAVLSRLKRDLGMVKNEKESFSLPDQPELGEVLSHKGSSSIFLEEYEFNQKERDLTAIVEILMTFGIEMSELEKQLLIMHDDEFAHFCQAATAITPHIAIDNNNKTVRPGALWYEESLPPDTLLYVMLLANDARNSSSPSLVAKEVLRSATEMFSKKPYLQIGGNETVGMGWCKVKGQP